MLIPYFLGSLKMKDYYDDAEMPGSRLNIRFHGNEKTSEQIFVIPFRGRMSSISWSGA